MKDQITYTHRIKRSYRLDTILIPPSPKHRFKCHCLDSPYLLICPACISQTKDLIINPTAHSVPVTWVRINSRAGDRCLVDIIGGSEPQMDIDLLRLWRVDPRAIQPQGIKSLEQYAAITRTDVGNLISTMRRYLVAPCPNQIIEGAFIQDDDRDPDDDADWSDGTKQVLYQGELFETSLPRLGKYCLRYFISVYQIGRTPEYPAKFEILALAPDGIWFPEMQMTIVRKAMSQFVLGVCQAARVDPLPIPSHLDMLGDEYTERLRGAKIDWNHVARGAVLADLCGRGDPDYPILERDNRVAALCCALGRPLSLNTIAEIHNCRGNFWRMSCSHRYFVPPAKRVVLTVLPSSSFQVEETTMEDEPCEYYDLPVTQFEMEDDDGDPELTYWVDQLISGEVVA